MHDADTTCSHSGTLDSSRGDATTITAHGAAKALPRILATALGLGGVWKSAPVLDSGPVRTLFGAAEHERLLGWVNLGSPGQPSRKKGMYASGGVLETPVTVVGD